MPPGTASFSDLVPFSSAGSEEVSPSVSRLPFCLNKRPGSRGWSWGSAHAGAEARESLQLLAALELLRGGSLPTEVTQATGQQVQAPDTRCSETAPFSCQLAGGADGPAGTYLPNAVFAEVFVVAENDDFVGHGCTDAEPVLNLKSSWRKKERRKKSITGVCTDSIAKRGKEHQLRAGLSALALLSFGPDTCLW